MRQHIARIPEPIKHTLRGSFATEPRRLPSCALLNIPWRKAEPHVILGGRCLRHGHAVLGHEARDLVGVASCFSRDHQETAACGESSVDLEQRSIEAEGGLLQRDFGEAVNGPRAVEALEVGAQTAVGDDDALGFASGTAGEDDVRGFVWLGSGFKFSCVPWCCCGLLRYIDGHCL